jgi:hypothetical protein
MDLLAMYVSGTMGLVLAAALGWLGRSTTLFVVLAACTALTFGVPVSATFRDAEDLLWDSRPELFLEFDRVSERYSEILWIMTISRARMIVAVQAALFIGFLLNGQLERRYRWYRRLVRVDPSDHPSPVRMPSNSPAEIDSAISHASTAPP